MIQYKNDKYDLIGFEWKNDYLYFEVMHYKDLQYKIIIPSNEVKLLSGKYFGIFYKIFEDYSRRNPLQRKGQALMNSLFQFYPQLYKQYLNTELDCFNNSKIMVNTLEQLRKDLVI